MNCPYCGAEMEQGVITSPYEINWKKESTMFSNGIFGNAQFHDEAVVLAELSFTKGSAAIAHLCRDCEKVVIDYQDWKSDFNIK